MALCQASRHLKNSASMEEAEAANSKGRCLQRKTRG